MFIKSRVCRGLIAGFGGAAVLLPTIAVAQDQSLQRVEITGSNIRRTDTETASPVQVITKADIDQAGKATVAQYLQTLTADGQGSVPFTYGRGFSGATAAGISLRGLGADSTLVLINGRRVAPAVLADDGARSFTDLNQIPMEAVERIEVVKDGASSIYGSDAVAGVVNIILKKNFIGTTVKGSYGMSQRGDGDEPHIAITHGFGDLATDGYNVLINVEGSKRDPIYYRKRDGFIGDSAISQFGVNPGSSTQNVGRAGGNGWLTTPAAGAINATLPSIVGNVRNPDTSNSGLNQNYQSRTLNNAAAQAYCAAHANTPQINPLGACLTDMWKQFGEVQPKQEMGTLYSRLTKAVNAETEAFVEVSLYRTRSQVQGTPLLPSSAIPQPNGVPLSNTAGASLGATHPDNPFQGAAARLSYNPGFEIGPQTTDSSSTSARVASGIKGVVAGWDYDTGISYSQSKQVDTAEKRINYRVSNALLNPTAANVAAATAFSPAYAALPAGTVWRIGENSFLNSQAMYAALLQDQKRQGVSREYGVDGKMSKELFDLPGGKFGVAIGGEYRHEALNLPFYSGLGNYIGLALTKYGGSRNIYAAYTEVLAPVVKTVELNAALRYDHYSDAGSSVTPKVGAKWKVADTLAVRGTYAFGFRAPSFAQNGIASLATFSGSTVNDTARCRAAPTLATTNCIGVAPSFLQQGNPGLKPEKSRSATIGTVWDLTPKDSVAIDLWQIKRTGLPVTQNSQAAIDAGNYVRDPAQSTGAGDPGPILTAFVQFINASRSTTRGVDLDTKSRWDLPNGYGRLNTSLTYTHLMMQRVTDDAGVHDYAGTHGNCDITNCIGTPRDKVSAAATWQLNQIRLGLNANFRGSFKNTLEKSSTTCATVLADGTGAPNDCRIASFTTFDLSGGYAFDKQTEVFGSIANIFKKTPPWDPLTYGAIGYNPLDYSGAIGRFFRVGLIHRF